MSKFIIKALVLNPVMGRPPYIHTEIIEAKDFKDALKKSGVGHDADEVTITYVNKT